MNPPLVRARQHPSSLVVIGQPVAHSLSPAMQGAALVAAGLSTRYERRNVAPDDLPAVIEEFRRGHVGGNATIPHKEALFAACGERSPMASRIGAASPKSSNFIFSFPRGHSVGRANTAIAKGRPSAGGSGCVLRA